jgi:predicted RNA binding protein YcfA (HicA-like mRNA interferase family)
VSKRLPSLKPRQIIETLLKAGFFVQRQSGSHVRMKHRDRPAAVTIARHDRMEFSHVLTQRILKQGQIEEDTFLDLL